MWFHIFLILLSTLLGVIGQILMKIGMTNVASIMGNNDKTTSFYLAFYIKAFLSPAVICGIFSYALSLISWLWVLTKVDLSYARPFISIGYVLVAFYGYYFLNENVTIERWIGIILICIGVFFVARS